jgi:polysaccharide deacetylase family protein (PEP-CTERM system associated)
MIQNIISVDLEDHFCDLPFNTWENFESRVENSTKILLELFEQSNTKATFFTVGYIAEKHPDLIKEIKNKGHEIASHSYSHLDLRKTTKQEFESDLIKSIETLEKISGGKILGFRAPWFSLTRENIKWVFEVLQKHLKYDSSLFPVGPHYGFSKGLRHIYQVSEDNPLKEDSSSTFIEIPMNTTKYPLLGNFPTAGGIYLRFLPLSLIKSGIKKMNKAGFSTICYIHPQDLDQSRPRLPNTAWHNYWGLNNSYKKIKNLLNSFKFTSARENLNL